MKFPVHLSVICGSFGCMLQSDDLSCSYFPISFLITAGYS